MEIEHFLLLLLTMKQLETYLKVKNLPPGLHHFGISEFYTEFKVHYKTKISNTETGNWYLMISKLNITIPKERGKERQGERKLPNMLTKSRRINEMSQYQQICMFS